MPQVQPPVFRIVLLWSALLSIALVLVACGTNSSLLKSVTITPSTASGQAQFTAVGMRVNGSTVDPAAVLWWNSMPWSTLPTPPPGITIDTTGKATCLSVAGTFTVWATAPTNQSSPLSQMTMSTPQVVGTAQITCP